MLTIKTKDMNTQEAANKWWDNLSPAQLDLIPNDYFLPGNKPRNECILTAWMQEVVLPWSISFEAGKLCPVDEYTKEYGQYPSDRVLAELYLKEHEVKEESGTKDGVLSLPGVFANHPRCVSDERELIQELTKAVSAVRHLLKACLDDTLPPIQEWIRIRKEYIEFLTPY